MVEPRQDPRLLQELLAGALVVGRAEPSGREDGAALAHRALGEELLDGHQPAQREVAALVRDPEASLPEELADRERAAGEPGAGREQVRGWAGLRERSPARVTGCRADAVLEAAG